jgi:hypothetical protein
MFDGPCLIYISNIILQGKKFTLNWT